MRVNRLNGFQTWALDFINGEEPAEAAASAIWRNLNRCVDLICQYRKDFDSVKDHSDVAQAKRALSALGAKLDQEVTDLINDCIGGSHLHLEPMTCSVDIWMAHAKGKNPTDEEIFRAYRKVFAPGDFVTSSPPAAQHAYYFRTLLSEPGPGIDNIYRCDGCKKKVFVSTYRRRQPFCSGNCRQDYHNRRKATDMARYMRGKRRREALVDWPLGEPVDWPAAFRKWNGKHYRKYAYGDLADFKRDWKLANRGKQVARSRR